MDNSAKTTRQGRWWVATILLLGACLLWFVGGEFLLDLLAIDMPSVAQVGFAADCMWSGQTVAWLDENANGTPDEGEPPLEGIRFHIDDVQNHYVDVGRSMTSVTDWHGETRVSVFLPGCPSARFEIYPEVPIGYHLTTAARLGALRRQQDRTFHFGFGYLPNTPTATPRPPPPTCTVYKIGNADRYDLTDVAVAADGTVWASTFNHGVARYVPAKDEFVYLTDGPANPQVRSITVSGANAVWFATEGGAARFDGRWTTYTTRDGLIDNSVYQVAIAADGSYWFATRGGVSHFNPNENAWTSYTPEQGLKSVRAIAAMPDGSVWVSTSLNGLYRFVPGDAQTKGYKVVGITGDPSGVIELAPDGSYWFANSRGVERFDPRTSLWTAPSAQPGRSILGGYVNALAFAPDGSLWIASTNTASDSAKIYHYIPSMGQGSLDSWRVYDTRDGLPKSAGSGDRAKAISVADNGVVWVASQAAVTRCVFADR